MEKFIFTHSWLEYPFAAVLVENLLENSHKCLVHIWSNNDNLISDSSVNVC